MKRSSTQAHNVSRYYSFIQIEIFLYREMRREVNKYHRRNLCTMSRSAFVYLKYKRNRHRQKSKAAPPASPTNKYSLGRGVTAGRMSLHLPLSLSALLHRCSIMRRRSASHLLEIRRQLSAAKALCACAAAAANLQTGEQRRPANR